MSFQACAEIVERGDPDRFLATMAAPPAARAVLFSALCLQHRGQPRALGDRGADDRRDAPAMVARRAGRDRRRQPGAQPRGHAATGRGSGRAAARALDRTVAARRWDIYREPFEESAHFAEHLDATAGELMWQAVRLLGGPLRSQAEVRATGYGAGLVRFLQAVPELEARGCVPLVDGPGPEAIRELAGARASGHAGPAHTAQDPREVVKCRGRPARACWSLAGPCAAAADRGRPDPRGRRPRGPQPLSQETAPDALGLTRSGRPGVLGPQPQPDQRPARQRQEGRHGQVDGRPACLGRAARTVHQPARGQ